MKEQKVLVLGGTGAMGVYLVPALIKKGYRVDVVSLDERRSDHPSLRYIQANAMDEACLGELLAGGYDGIVDFLFYGTEQFSERHEALLSGTGHYIFLSSYRVYANEETPIREESPRLLEVQKDRAFLASDDYALAKCREEDILQQSAHRNWTIVRPAITYSQRRFQLVTLEANVIVGRARANKPVVLPKEARHVQATMTWAGDVANMFTGVLFNAKAQGQRYTFSTAEHNTWEDVASCYEACIGLQTLWVDREDYLQIINPTEERFRAPSWQLDYDRLYDRVVDNRKILVDAGLRQEGFTRLKDGLARELAALPEDCIFPDDRGVGARMDAWLGRKPPHM